MPRDILARRTTNKELDGTVNISRLVDGDTIFVTIEQGGAGMFYVYPPGGGEPVTHYVDATEVDATTWMPVFEGDVRVRFVPEKRSTIIAHVDNR